MAGADLFPTAGCRIYLGSQMDTQVADFVEADFVGVSPPLSFTEIDGWSSMGAFGDTAALVSQDLINRGRTTKQKGTFNAGQMQNVFASIPEDAGQIALIAASRTRLNYVFKVVLNDGDDTASPVVNPSERYFLALVMNAEEQGGDANTIRNLAATLEINSNIVSVAASA